MIVIQDLMTPLIEHLDVESRLKDAVLIMKKHRWDTVPVLDQQQNVVGVFTRSRLFQMILDEQMLNAPILPYIKEDVFILPANTTFEQIQVLTRQSLTGSGVVIDSDGKAIGIVTKTDLVNTYLEAVKLTKEQLEIVLTSSQLGAFMTNETGKIIFINQKLCQWLNVREEDIINKPFQSYFPNLQLVLTDHSYMSVGELQTIARISSYQLLNQQHGYIAIFQDVTEVESIAIELQSVKNLVSLLDNTVNYAYDGIVMVNEQKIITLVNDAFAEFFGLEKESLMGKQLEDVLPSIEWTNLSKLSVAQISDMQELNGIKFIVQQIPVFHEEKMIGGIIKIIYRQLYEVMHRMKQLHTDEKNTLMEQRKNHITSKFSFSEIITQNPQMNKLIRSASKAAKGNVTVLVRGQSGTGKELFAHAIHSMSMRSDGPFVTVNCAAIPEHLLESEFFGYEEGAFTGAHRKGKAGKLELANGGTLFLDEIGDMSLALQAKLLRVLQEREFYRVGGNELVKVNVRIIAATNRLLETMVEAGEFREDLYYRLNVFSIDIPPLKERREDIPLMISHMIQDLNQHNGTSVSGVEDETMQLFLQYDWPGNVRELRNVLERAMIFAEHGNVTKTDLPEYIFQRVQASSNEVEDSSLMEIAEKQVIIEALLIAKHNKSKAAELLGISRSLLYKKMDKYEIG